MHPFGADAGRRRTTMHELDSVLATVPQPLRPGVALHWQRYCEACARDGIEPVAAGWPARLS